MHDGEWHYWFVLCFVWGISIVAATIVVFWEKWVHIEGNPKNNMIGRFLARYFCGVLLYEKIATWVKKEVESLFSVCAAHLIY